MIAGIAGGDSDAATELVRRHQRRVYGLAKLIVGDAQLAEDVAQEAFTRAWRHAASFDPRKASVTTWLLTITRNLAIDSRRVRRPEPHDPGTLGYLADLADLATGSVPGPQERAETSLDVVRLTAALAALPEEQRRAIVLAALGGRTAKEVGDLEGIPLGTAKTRIRTALQRLRSELAPLREGGADGL